MVLHDSYLRWVKKSAAPKGCAFPLRGGLGNTDNGGLGDSLGVDVGGLGLGVGPLPSGERVDAGPHRGEGDEGVLSVDHGLVEHCLIF